MAQYPVATDFFWWSYSVSSGILLNQCSSDFFSINNHLYALVVSGSIIKISHISFGFVDLGAFNILWIIFASLQGFSILVCLISGI